ncbi:BadF/BadG/BcrA/BcrD ATPase family protein [Microbacterium aoyamense]|uniref:BadF/BadG/BcrA/BcrD ATPase family protein n=1 Tax=Microbacterium aoyamense TaxID=344166 RepID=A0ABP5AZ51_9MICO|nr:BadF/BadG/BcrA/BcrD ATPase family protein [Microbacterium aoyamense]
MRLLVGLDLGGSKSAVLATTTTGDVVVDVVHPAHGWDAEPIESGVAWVQALLARALPPDGDIVALGIGAQGLDSPETVRSFTRALSDAGLRAVCVNDAALLVPAAGFAQGIGLIAGTGAIGVGADAHGDALITGGWGWVLGDDAGAAGLVREATKAALLAHDDGTPDDGLLGALQGAFDVDSPERLARRVNDEPTMANWAPAARAVFAAADAGSTLAARVIDAGGEHLVRLVDQLVRRGAVGTDVVCAGGVISHQPRLFDAVRAGVAERHPDFAVHLLTRPPVVGALALARTLITADTKE